MKKGTRRMLECRFVEEPVDETTLSADGVQAISPLCVKSEPGTRSWGQRIGADEGVPARRRTPQEMSDR